MPGVVPKNPNAPENIGKLAKIKNSPMVKLYHSSPYKNIDEVGFNAETQLEMGDKRGIFFSTYPQENYGEFVYEVLVPRKAITWDTLGGKKEKLTDAIVKPEYSNLIQFSRKEHGVENYLIDNAPSPYPQQAALDLAQQRAALPIEQGGLGLPVGNTAMDRAKAMGYPMGKGFDVSYETGHSPIAITDTLSKPTSPRNKAEIIKAELEQMGIPVVGETAGTGSTYLKIPGNPYDISPEYGGGQSVPIETLRFSTHSKREFGKPTNRPDLDSYIADVFPKGGNSLEEARKAIDDLIKQGGMRSRFAAFDPFRRNAAIAAAMGVAAPDLMAAPIGGIGAGAGTQDNEMPDAVRQYMANPTPGLLQDDEERKKLGGLLFR
jgi:hypothetical protein